MKENIAIILMRQSKQVLNLFVLCIGSQYTNSSFKCGSTIKYTQKSANTFKLILTYLEYCKILSAIITTDARRRKKKPHLHYHTNVISVRCYSNTGSFPNGFENEVFISEKKKNQNSAKK